MFPDAFSGVFTVRSVDKPLLLLRLSMDVYPCPTSAQSARLRWFSWERQVASGRVTILHRDSRRAFKKFLHRTKICSTIWSWKSKTKSARCSTPVLFEAEGAFVPLRGLPRLSPPPSSFGGFSPRSQDLGLFFCPSPPCLALGVLSSARQSQAVHNLQLLSNACERTRLAGARSPDIVVAVVPAR